MASGPRRGPPDRSWEAHATIGIIPTKRGLEGGAGAGEFGRGVAGDSGVVHHPRLGHVPGAGLVQQASVIPQHGVADRPPVMIDTWRLAGMVHQRPE